MRETMLHDVASETEWRERAGCREHPPILFFGADDSEPQAERRIREDEAKQVCARCLVRLECLDYALSTREAYGIWGGLTEVERRAQLRKRN
jgi:WhiB family transcriptional regulator, redox-sensing transcriptional regulator